MPSNKHYWKRNEIIFLKECVDKHTGKILVHWSDIRAEFNSKYHYDLSIEELETAYNLYFNGGRRK